MCREEVLLESNILKARLLGSAVLNVQAATRHVDGHVASNWDIADLYCWAHETEMRHGVVPSFELNVNMWSQHFGLVAKAAALAEARELSFRMTLDHCHVIFKTDKPKV